MADRFIVDFVDVLQDGKCADFTDDSREQPVNVLCVIADEKELVAKLREVGLDALAHLSEHDGEGLGALLVGTRRGLKSDVGRLEQVELHLCTDIPLVVNDAAVVILQLHVVQIVDVVHIGRRDVVGVEHSACTGKPVQLVSVVELPL